MEFYIGFNYKDDFTNVIQRERPVLDKNFKRKASSGPSNVLAEEDLPHYC